MQKRVTVNTLAKQLGVNPSTVSRAFAPNSGISDEVRKKILDLAQKEGYKPNKAASRLTMKEIRIGILINDVYPESFSEFTRGIKDAYERFYDYKISYDILIFKNTEQDEEHAKAYFERFNDFDGLIVSGLTSKEMAKELINYSENHKNIVSLQSETKDLPYLFSSSHDGSTASSMAAQFLAIALSKSESKNVVLFTGSKILEVHQDSERSFRKTCEEYGLNLCAVYDMDDDDDILLNQAQELFNQKDVDGIYISSGKSISLCKFIKNHGLADKVTLVTSDTYPTLNEFVEDGTVQATVYQNFHDLAYNAFALLVQKIVDKADIPTKISPRPEMVIKSNLHLYR